MRRLPDPAFCRLSEGDPNSRGSLRIVSGLAENTNSIFCDGSSEFETANGCLVLPSRNRLPRGILLRVEHPRTVDLHALLSVPGTPVPQFDK